MMTLFYITMTLRVDVRPARGQRTGIRFYLSLGQVRVCEIEQRKYRFGVREQTAQIETDKQT